jgi:phospholipase/carboxylesterase
MSMTTESNGLSRRHFLGALGATALLPALPTWRLLSDGARLSARLGKPTEAWTAGLTKMWDDKPASFLYVPKSYDGTKPIPLVVGLHGAGQRSSMPLRLWTPHADSAGFALVVPESSGMTWDAIRGEYGDDPAVIDRALAYAFARLNVDTQRLIMQGFSDGASYGLGLALNNMELFPRVVANSPGFITRYEKHQRGRKPGIFLSHGHQDQILPFELAGARVVGQLRNEGFSVEFREFEGGHTVPVDGAGDAVRFMLKG